MSTVGFFGKIAARGDFVRVNVSGDGPLSLASWLDSVVEETVTSGVQLPKRGVYFFFREANKPSAFVGFARVSQDSVGRRFPSTVFAELDQNTVAQSFAGIPSAYAEFFSVAQELSSEYESIAVDTLNERLARIQLPSPERIQASHQDVLNAMAETTSDMFHRDVLGTPSRDAAYYAYSTLLTAAQRGQTLLDCSYMQAQQLGFWLELGGRALSARQKPPGFIWQPPVPSASYGSFTLENLPPAKAGRLLLSPGSLPPISMALVDASERQHNKLWPLTTESEAARKRSRESLPAGLRGVLDSSEPPLDAVAKGIGR